MYEFYFASALSTTNKISEYRQAAVPPATCRFAELFFNAKHHPSYILYFVIVAKLLALEIIGHTSLIRHMLL